MPENIATTSGTVTPIRLDVQDNSVNKSNKEKETTTTTGQVLPNSINTEVVDVLKAAERFGRVGIREK